MMSDMDLSADLDSKNCKLTKLIQDMADFKNNFPSIQNARLLTRNGPHQDLLQVPSSSAAAEAMNTESPMLSEADHCLNITAAQTQLKDKEKAVDMIREILTRQNILIDGGVIQPTAIKPTMDGLKKAEDALAEATKRHGWITLQSAVVLLKAEDLEVSQALVFSSVRVERRHGSRKEWIQLHVDHRKFRLLLGQSACSITSPPFIVNGIDNTKWRLVKGQRFKEDFENFRLYRDILCKGPKRIEVDAELEYLKADGSSLSSDICVNLPLSPGDTCSLFDHEAIEEGFRIDKQTFFPRGILKVRCTLWKSRERKKEKRNRKEMEKSVWCLGRTIIGVKRRSFKWVNFIAEKSSCRIEPESEDEISISLHLVSFGQLYYIHIWLLTDIKDAMNMTLKYALISASGNNLECGEKELRFSNYSKQAEFPLQISTEELVAKMSLNLPNNDLTLQCECAYSTRIVYQKIESIDYSPFSNQPEKYAENALPDPLRALKDNLTSLHSECFLSDVKLKTKTSTHPAHKTILGARSPVFRAMFQTEMKEKISQYVEIPDLDEETVRLMLQFMYTADVPDLRWNSACQLYEAADKYDIPSLKETCSSFLVSNLSVTNVCELLALFDMHQDADQKQVMQNFILK